VSQYNCMICGRTNNKPVPHSEEEVETICPKCVRNGWYGGRLNNSRKLNLIGQDDLNSMIDEETWKKINKKLSK
jgi:uncharacterized protein CbrC (UPF0167 family)